MTAATARESNICACGRHKGLGLLLCEDCWFFLDQNVREKLVEAMTRRRINLDAAYQNAVEDLQMVRPGVNGGRVR